VIPPTPASEARPLSDSFWGSYGSQGSYSGSYSSSPPTFSTSLPTTFRLPRGNSLLDSPTDGRGGAGSGEHRDLGGGWSGGYAALEQREDKPKSPLRNPLDGGRDAELGLPAQEESSSVQAALLRNHGRASLATVAAGRRGSPNGTRLCILDFCGATGLDASAARSCFLMLKQV
jgi:hypothetical protein